MIATTKNQISVSKGNNMKFAVGVMILSIFALLAVSPVSSSYFDDGVMVTDTIASSYSISDSNNQETFSVLPILLTIGIVGLVAVRRDSSNR